MPMGDQLEDHGRLMRTLIYGKDKSKKTWWACKAAEDGYNVILLDGDDGATIIKNISLEARKRILVLNLCDTADKPVFARFIATFIRGEPFIWDEQSRVSLPLATKLNPEHSYVRFDPSKFTANDVVIPDSFTALAASTTMAFAMETNTDLTQIERDGDNFALPNYQARYLDHVLNKIKTLNAHVIVIGHETNYEKYKGKGKERKVVGDYIQPISSTGPQGQKLGKFFENVLRFYRLSDTAYRIDAGGDDSRAGGSRLIAPKVWTWDEVTPQTLMKELGSKPTGAPCLGAIYIPKGTIEFVVPYERTTNPEAEKTPAQPQVVQAGSLANRIALSKNKPQT